MERAEKRKMLDDYCGTCSTCGACRLSRPGLCYDRDGEIMYWKDMDDDRLDKCLEILQQPLADPKALQAELEASKEPQPDNVNHPLHYELPSGLECFDVIVATQGVEATKHFCLCNAMKYLFRSQRKNGDEDIEKARWYLNKYHELKEK